MFVIRGWDKHFENNRTRELIEMKWVPVPNKHDGDGYTELMSMSDGLALYGAWHLILQVASKCDPRGTLVRDGGRPHDAESIARITRAPVKSIERALSVLVNLGWLESSEIPQECATTSQEGAAIPQASDYGKERKGKEEKEGAQEPPPVKDTEDEKTLPFDPVAVWCEEYKREYRKNPAMDKKDRGIAWNLARLVVTEPKFRGMCRAFIADKNQRVVNAGHPISWMSTGKNRYLLDAANAQQSEDIGENPERT